MPGLKDLQLRIKSIKSIQKTTKVMQMISASKLRRSQNHLEYARFYNDYLFSLLPNENTTNEKESIVSKNNINDDSHLIVIFASDRGLCGGFNNSIFKMVKSYIDELTRSKKEVKLVIFGKKIYDLLRQYHSSVLKVFCYDKNTNVFAHFKSKIYQILELYNFSKIEVFYNKFYNTLLQKPVKQVLIPMENFIDNSINNIKYEPNKKIVFDKLRKDYLLSALYTVLLESITSEHCARMLAMESANRNTKEMLGKLILKYNRTRQAVITTDLIEIIGGAESLNE